jgi:short chain dehydrogenase/Amidohydrolase
MDLGLNDATAVVVGGGRGMGFAAARCLADDGARVALVGRTQAVLDSAAWDLAERGSPDALGLVADTTDAGQVQRVFDDLSRAIDVDNHYYETTDSCTRHLPKEFKRRGVQMVKDGKRTLAVMAERVNHFIPNPTFDPIIEPGCLDLLFRGEIPEGVDPASLMKVDRMENHPEYQNRDARVKVLDKQNLETVFMLPTFACGVEEALKHDIEATMATVHAFNLWLDEDWGFNRPDGQIVSAPIISLADPERAIEEVEFVLERGAKMVLVRPAPVPGVVKPRSLGDPLHDPVWARLAEGGIPVGFHLSDSGYLAIAALWGGKATFEGFGKKDPLDQVLLDDRAIHDTMASMIVHQVFTRIRS